MMSYAALKRALARHAAGRSSPVGEMVDHGVSAIDALLVGEKGRVIPDIRDSVKLRKKMVQQGVFDRQAAFVRLQARLRCVSC